MKRYSLIVACVLIAGTSAWGYGLDSYNCAPSLTRCYTPGPCYTPPVCAPSPCYNPCNQQPTGVTFGAISSSQNAVLASNCGPGMAYASNRGGLMIYGQDGCRPTFQVETYRGCAVDFNCYGGFGVVAMPNLP